LQKIYEIKCECQIACQKICSKSVTWWGLLQKNHLFRRLSKIHEDSQHDALRGPARIIAIINNGNHIKHLILDSFVSFFLRFGCRDAFCTDTFLQADGVTHRNLYTEQFLRADILTQRGL